MLPQCSAALLQYTIVASEQSTVLCRSRINDASEMFRSMMNVLLE